MTLNEKLEEIKNHPERHHHDFAGLQACCMHEGAFDSQLAEAHEKYAALGYNGGQACDVTSGPCSCGAWH